MLIKSVFRKFFGHVFHHFISCYFCYDRCRCNGQRLGITFNYSFLLSFIFTNLMISIHKHYIKIRFFLYFIYCSSHCRKSCIKYIYIIYFFFIGNSRSYNTFFFYNLKQLFSLLFAQFF